MKTMNGLICRLFGTNILIHSLATCGMISTSLTDELQRRTDTINSIGGLNEIHYRRLDWK